MISIVAAILKQLYEVTANRESNLYLFLDDFLDGKLEVVHEIVF